MTNDKTAEKLLREQLALLAERSKNALNEELPGLTASMLEIYHALNPIVSSSQFHPESD